MMNTARNRAQLLPLPAEVADYKARVIAAGGSITNTTLKALANFNTAVAPIRDKIVRFNPFTGADLTAALVPLYFNTNGSATPVGNSTDTNNGFVSGDYALATGLGDGSNTAKFLQTGVIPSTNATVSQDDMTFGIWLLNNLTSDKVMMSSWNGDGAYGANLIYGRRAANLKYTGVNTASGGTPSVTCTDERGMNLLSRLSGTGYTYTLNGADQGVTAASAQENNSEFRLFGRAASFGTNKAAGYIIAAGLSSVNRTILYNAWAALNSAIGR